MFKDDALFGKPCLDHVDPLAQRLEYLHVANLRTDMEVESDNLDAVHLGQRGNRFRRPLCRRCRICFRPFRSRCSLWVFGSTSGLILSATWARLFIRPAIWLMTLKFMQRLAVEGKKYPVRVRIRSLCHSCRRRQKRSLRQEHPCSIAARTSLPLTQSIPIPA